MLATPADDRVPGPMMPGVTSARQEIDPSSATTPSAGRLAASPGPASRTDRSWVAAAGFASPRALFTFGEGNRRTSVLLVTAAACVGLGALGCARGTRDAGWQTIEAIDTQVTYDADLDRIVGLRLRNRPNMLHAVSLDQPPRANEDYTFYGGHYSWIAPQSAWVDGEGNLRNWPPDPSMDRGPMLVTRHTGRSLVAEGPVTRLGLREEKLIEVLGRGIVGVEHRLTNATDSMREGAVWSNTAVPPGAVIAVPKPADGTDIRFDRASETAEPLWAAITEEVDDWILIHTDAEAAERAAPWGGELKVFISAPPQIAVRHGGYWFVRRGYPWDDAASLSAVGEAPVEVYLNFGLELFEAELLGPYVELGPGEATEFSEVWFIFDSFREDPREIDVTFEAYRRWLGMAPAEESAEEEAAEVSEVDASSDPAAAPTGGSEGAPPDDALSIDEDKTGPDGGAPALDPGQFIEDRP